MEFHSKKPENIGVLILKFVINKQTWSSEKYGRIVLVYLTENLDRNC